MGELGLQAVLPSCNARPGLERCCGSNGTALTRIDGVWILLVALVWVVGVEPHHIVGRFVIWCLPESGGRGLLSVWLTPVVGRSGGCLPLGVSEG